MTIFGLPLPGELYLRDPLAQNPEADFETRSRFFNLGQIVSSLLPYLFIFGGIILLGMLVYGGFEMMTSLGNEEKFKAGAERVKNGLIGFLMLFGVYWLAQLAQVMFKIPIL
jgi:hypothetical protein